MARFIRLTTWQPDGEPVHSVTSVDEGDDEIAKASATLAMKKASLAGIYVTFDLFDADEDSSLEELAERGQRAFAPRAAYERDSSILFYDFAMKLMLFVRPNGVICSVTKAPLPTMYVVGVFSLLMDLPFYPAGVTLQTWSKDGNRVTCKNNRVTFEDKGQTDEEITAEVQRAVADARARGKCGIYIPEEAAK